MNAAKLAITLVLPADASPAAIPTRLLSAIPMLKNRSGYFLPNHSVRVELPTSASTTTTPGYQSALQGPGLRATRPNASRVALAHLSFRLQRREEAPAMTLDLSQRASNLCRLLTRLRRRPRPGPRRGTWPARSLPWKLVSPSLRSRLRIPWPLWVKATMQLGCPRRRGGASSSRRRDLAQVVAVDHLGLPAGKAVNLPSIGSRLEDLLGRAGLLVVVAIDDEREGYCRSLARGGCCSQFCSFARARRHR